MKIELIGVLLSILAAFIIIASLATDIGYVSNNIFADVVFLISGLAVFTGSLIAFSGKQRLGVIVIEFFSLMAIFSMYGTAVHGVGAFWGGWIGLLSGLLILSNSKKK